MSVIIGREPQKYALNPGILFWLVLKNRIDSEMLLTIDIEDKMRPIGWNIPL